MLFAPNCDQPVGLSPDLKNLTSEVLRRCNLNFFAPKPQKLDVYNPVGLDATKLKVQSLSLQNPGTLKNMENEALKILQTEISKEHGFENARKALMIASLRFEAGIAAKIGVTKYDFQRPRNFHTKNPALILDDEDFFENSKIPAAKLEKHKRQGNKQRNGASTLDSPRSPDHLFQNEKLQFPKLGKRKSFEEVFETLYDNEKQENSNESSQIMQPTEIEEEVDEIIMSQRLLQNPSLPKQKALNLTETITDRNHIEMENPQKKRRTLEVVYVAKTRFGMLMSHLWLLQKKTEAHFQQSLFFLCSKEKANFSDVKFVFIP